MIPLGTSLVHFSQGDVHKSIAVDQMSVESFSILQLDKLRAWISGRRGQRGEV